jgi:hypothetical protein
MISGRIINIKLYKRWLPDALHEVGRGMVKDISRQ